MCGGTVIPSQTLTSNKIIIDQFRTVTVLQSLAIVEAGKEGLPRQKLVQMFIKISRKVLDLEISDHMGWKALCFLFLVICVLAPKDLLRPPCASLFIKKKRFFGAEIN